MQLISFKDVIYKGKGLCDCVIDKDMTLEEALIVYCNMIKSLAKSVRLNSVNTGKLLIQGTLDPQTMLADILNSLIEADISIKNQITTITSSLTTLMSSINNVVDEKVKVSSTDTAGFLNTKLVGKQPGTVIASADKIEFIGFAPVGSVMYINKSRLSDFDGTGKGKSGTDVYGWAICNGQNGTTNRLNKFPRYTDDVNAAGNIGGADSVTLAESNIPGFTMSVTGTISESLSAMQFQIKLNARHISDNAGGNALLLESGNGQNGPNNIWTIPSNLNHSHAFDLQARRVNTAASFSILPSFIKEIPIERIPV